MGAFSWPHFFRNAGVIALCVAAVAYVARFNIRDNVWPRNVGVVEPGVLVRSGRLTPAATEQVVREHGIRTIIDLGAYIERPYESRVSELTARALGVRLVRLSLEGDGTGDPDQYAEALRVIMDPANHPVLVHCAAGAQRTSGCVMLYRRLTVGKPFEAGIAEAEEFKHDPEKNPALLAYMRRWGDAIVEAVRGGGPVRRGE